MKPISIAAAAMAVLLAIGATVCVWHQQAELPGSRRPEANQRREGRASRPESFSLEPGKELPVLFKALLEMRERGAQEEHSNAVAEAPNADTPATPPMEPSLLNIDDPPVGPHADQIVTAQVMDAEELSDSELMNQAPGSAIHSLSGNAEHNAEIARGETRTEGQSVGPAEVDPDSHPPTN